VARPLALPPTSSRDQVNALVDGTSTPSAGRRTVTRSRMDTFESFDAVDLGKWRQIFEVTYGRARADQACVPHLKKAAAEHGRCGGRVIISMSMRNIRPPRGWLLVVEGRIRPAKTMRSSSDPTGVA